MREDEKKTGINTNRISRDIKLNGTKHGTTLSQNVSLEKFTVSI